MALDWVDDIVLSGMKTLNDEDEEKISIYWRPRALEVDDNGAECLLRLYVVHTKSRTQSIFTVPDRL